MNNSTNAKKGRHGYLHDDFWEVNLDYFIKTYPNQKAYYLGLAEKDAQEREKKAKSNYMNWVK